MIDVTANWDANSAALAAADTGDNERSVWSGTKLGLNVCFRQRRGTATDPEPSFVCAVLIGRSSA